jgi:hypothetical protein
VAVRNKLELMLKEDVRGYSECTNSKLSATANGGNIEIPDFGQKFESVSSQTKGKATTRAFLQY